MIIDTKKLIHIEDDEVNEQFTSWYFDKKNNRIVSLATPSKEQVEMFGGLK